ncbi:oxidoreductase [Nocardia sp. NPDC088792]|uniref:oxidoreductase n=1 Tax=Nocardia sp. NPDC088792 TaxID=3364332 RepID=UPI003822BA4E
MANPDSGLERAGTFPLGDRRVHRIGYGAMQLAGDGVFGPPHDRDEALRVLRAAVAAGIDHIDTAQYYGPGTVNELIREALHPYPDNLVIVSKVGARRGSDGSILLFDEPDELTMGIEENLETLGVDRLGAVNLRLLDGAVPGKRFDAQLAAMIRAREAGLIEGIGLSNISRQHLLRALDQTPIVCVQNLFNVVERGSSDLLAECAAHNVAFVPFCPLGMSREARRRIRTDPQSVSIAKRLNATPAQVALAWLLDLSPNILLIPGTKNSTHLAENIDSGTVALDDADRRSFFVRVAAGPEII